MEKLIGAMHRRQKEVAKALGYHPVYFSRKIKNRIILEDLNKIAEYLGRDAMEFIKVVKNGNHDLC